MSQTILFCFCGPTASGKSTVCTKVASKLPGLQLSVSTTSRAPRPGEVDGREYHFVSRDEFLSRVCDGRFIEHAEFSGNLYGTEFRNLDEAREKGRDLLFDIEVQGIAQLKKLYGPQVVTVFVFPPSFEVLVSRLKNRGSETPEQMALRLERAREELRILTAPGFSDYLVINDDLETAIESASAIIRAERSRVARLSSTALATIRGE